MERKCQTVGCLSATRRIDYVHHNYDSHIYPFVQLGQKLNISRFVDIEGLVEQEYRGTMCQVGYIGWGMGALSSGNALKGVTYLLWKYNWYRLIHGGDPEQHVSPFHFRSLSQPFLPAVWACLAASSCGLACAFVLLGAHSTSAAAGRALVFIISAWLGNAQDSWVPSPGGKCTPVRGSTVNALTVSILAVSFFVATSYCAYIQTQRVVPGSYQSSMTFQQLVQRKYRISTAAVTFRLVGDVFYESLGM